jgi:SAM-dependent methyltransferase
VATAVVRNSEGAEFELVDRPCPTCGTEATRVLGWRGGRHHRYGLGVETRIVQCRTCSLIFPNPFPYPTKLSELYGDPEKYFAAHDEAQKVEAFRALARDVAARVGAPNPSVIDVGCGRGEFLRAARLEQFSNVVGLELSTEIAEHAASFDGLRIVRETVEEFAAHTDERFDAVMLSAVIEHVHDPDMMLRAVSQITRKGAVVYIDAPCEPHLLTMVGNRLNRVRRSSAVYNLAPTFPPYHVFGFNPKALRVLLAKHGFDLEEIRVHAGAKVPSRPELQDRVRAFAATQINHVANVLRLAANMYGWARRR